MNHKNYYILKKKNTNLLEFTLETNALDELECRIIQFVQSPHLLPYKLEMTGHTLLSWLENRFIPKNRAFVEKRLGIISGVVRDRIRRLLV